MNSEQQQQRIMGYFIEEAREHLQTIEQGVLNLQDILDEPESINEVFRAAHSIKGGAAMLGVSSIQHVAHRLEDFFKIIRENPHINVDERLKSLLLAGFDPLSELLDELQVGFKISDELTLETSNRVKPIFAELQSYLNQLTNDSNEVAPPIQEAVPAVVEAIQPAQIESQEAIFQKEVTTRMRDMLQVFRGEDSPATRAELQAICTYFQEIGNKFELHNWTHLVTQIKNAIAQPTNTYRSLAPILIRELKEAQDLVLGNREVEIIVSAQVQNLLPSWFAETEDDEVSTIFTTVGGSVEEEDSILEELAMANTQVTESKNTVTDLEEIDLFADDPSSEEVFDLSEGQDSPIDQLDWIDGEYEISENQHIDGPKIGASELKSLAVLFENDDIDFDAAWEDIESNETNMMNQGIEQTSDNHDDFADLLGQEYDNETNASSSKSTLEESNIDQLFGDFPTEELATSDNQIAQDGLFPDDLDNTWVESAVAADSEGSGLEDLFSNDEGNNEDVDLGIDIIEQIHDLDESANAMDIADISLDESNLNEDIDSVEYQSSIETELADELADQDLGNELNDQIISSQPSLLEEALSSEDNFATLENEVTNPDVSDSDFSENSVNSENEPFALTVSEEDMALLEDPFAIDASFDDSLMTTSTDVIDEISEEDEESDFDIFAEENVLESEDDINPLESVDDTHNSNNDDTSGLNIFDELGFDSDDFDTTLGSQSVEMENNVETEVENIASSDFNDVDPVGDDLADFFAEDQAESLINMEPPDVTEFEEQINSADDLESIFAETTDRDLGEISNDFGIEASNEEIADSSADIPTTESLGDFLDEVEDALTNAESLGEFFSEANSESTNTDDVSNFFGEDESGLAEITSSENLGDFFGESEPEVTNTEELENLFGEGDEEVTHEFANTEELGNFFGEDDVEVTSTENLDDAFNGIDASEEPSFADNGLVSDVSDLGDFFGDHQEIDGNEADDVAIADVVSTGTVIESADELGNFFADAEEDLSDGFTFLNDVSNEIQDTEEIGDFFSEPESVPDLLVPDEVKEEGVAFNYEVINEFDDQQAAVERVEEDLDEFLASDDDVSPTSVTSDFADFEDFEEEIIAETNALTQLSSQEQDEIDFEDPSPNFLGANDQDEADLAILFSSAGEDDLTLLENEINFDESRSLTQVESQEDVNDFLGEDFFGETHDDSLESDVSDDLTSIQDRFNDLDTELRQIDMSEDEVTASTTIDNLADFFQGDDDDSENLFESEDNINDDNLTAEAIADFDGLLSANEDQNDQLEISETEDQSLVIENSVPSTPTTSEDSSHPVIEELNGIDDNFSFDDLEAMIGDTGGSANGFADSINSVGSNTTVHTTPNSMQQPANSEDMNFDELEALLGDTGSFDSPAVNDNTTKPPETPPAKPVDDFDELENMLQSAFAKDVGPIKTKTPTRPPAAARKQRMADTTMRVDVKYLDSLNNLVGELVVNRNLLEQDQERLQQFITSLLHQVQMLSDVSQRMRDQYDRSLLEASLTAGRGGRSYNSFESSFSSENSSSSSTVSSEFEGIEFDRYNTFHVLSQEIIELIVRVRESASDIEFVVGETDQVTRQLGTITTQIQDDLKQSRMVPFAQIADRLPRGIRDRALKTGKQAELEIFGRETLIDKAILESLTDPLTHLVNNAIDHGLEDPVTRQAAGKPATGKLTVRAYHQGNQTVISISDDGAGISIDKVKKSAVAKKVRTLAEVDRLNDTEVYSLLFEPGFSTAAQADEFKGRGVGLDVVKTCLDEIRGVIIVESVVGKGTTFTIRLPLTLSISKAMFCISDRARIAFPVDGFEDMVEVPQSQIVLNEKGQPCLPWRDTVLPFQHLSNLLSYSRHLSRSNIYGKGDNDELCIIILRNDTNYLALQVDQFLGEYEIVIKQLEGPIPQPAGIAGATVLGDGRVMAIANVLELFDIASGRLRPSASGVVAPPPVEEDVAVDPTVLIVDDSITVRELLSLTFAKVGYRVEQAKDGQDAWEKLRAGLPCDMIFCDIEMPRMDGLDLLSRLQKDSRLKEIPVAMLTSRGADRHRQSAIQLGAKGYFTKPYLEEELLSASKRLLNGETLPI